MSVRIIVDSTADIAPSYEGKMLRVPLTVCFGDTEYLDGVTINKSDFYEKLVTSPVLPTTSQATPQAFIPAFEEVKQAGDSAVVIVLSSKLSGTYQSACIAAEDYDNIYVVDSLNVAVGSGILAQFAVDCAEKGMDAKSIADLVLEKREKLSVIALVDTLEYLKRGGRISKTVAFAGGVLGIKPVVCVKDGEVAIIGKARGSKQANNLLAEKVTADGVDYSMPVLLGYAGVSDELLLNYIRDSADLWQSHVDHLEYTQICSVIGTHVGPGAIAAAFFNLK